MDNSLSIDFSEYLSACDEKGINSESRLSLSEFQSLQSNGPVPHDKIRRHLEFTMPQMANKFGEDLVSGVTQRLSPALDHAFRENLGMSPAEAIGIANTASEVGRTIFSGATKVASAVSDRMSGSGSGSGSGGGGSSYEVSGSPGIHGWAQSDRVPPIEVRLDTGIVPNSYSTDRDTVLSTGSDVVSVPIHIQFIKVEIPYTSFVKDWFEELQTFRIRNQAQANVSFSIPAGRLTNDNLRSYFNAILSALSVYYTFESVIAYTESNFNRNRGLFEIRKQITPTAMLNLLMLRKLLEGLPMPKNLFTYVYWLFSHYRTTSTADGALLKFSAVDIDAYGKLDESFITDAIASLDDHSIISSLLRRTFPAWLQNTIPGSPEGTLHDTGFSTLFWNSSFSVTMPTTDGEVTYNYPQVGSSGTTRMIGTYDNNLDGAITASFSLYDNTADEWTPGLLKPFSSENLYCSRATYALNAAGGHAFISWLDITRKDAMTDYTHGCVSNGTSWYQVITPSCQALLGVSIDTISETLIKVMEWFMSWDDTMVKPGMRLSTANNMDDTSGRSKGRRPRRKKRK